MLCKFQHLQYKLSEETGYASTVQKQLYQANNKDLCKCDGCDLWSHTLVYIHTSSTLYWEMLWYCDKTPEIDKENVQ